MQKKTNYVQQKNISAASPLQQGTINWLVRFKNKSFWLALIPAVLILIQVIAAIFGYQMDLGDLGNRLIAVVNALFVVLAIVGVVNDPTTEGILDSVQAMHYIEPKK